MSSFDSDASNSALIDLANSSLPAPYNDSSASLPSLTHDLIRKHPTSAQHIFAQAKAQSVLDTSSQSSQNNIENILSSIDKCPEMTLEDARNGAALLKELHAPRTALTTYMGNAVKRWPDAKVALERLKGYEETEAS